MRRILVGMAVVLLFTGILNLVPTSYSTCGKPKIRNIVVPRDYQSIQKAIDSASQGDTIFVRKGIYCENLVVNKTVSLVGQGKEATIVDGGRVGNVVEVKADNVKIAGFTIRNSGRESEPQSIGILLNNSKHCSFRNIYLVGNNIGMWLSHADNNQILEIMADSNTEASMVLFSSYMNSVTESLFVNSTGHVVVHDSQHNFVAYNTMTSSTFGLLLYNSSRNLVFKNVFRSSWSAMSFEDQSDMNKVIENRVLDSQHGIVMISSSGNIVYHNGFCNNPIQASSAGCFNIWDNGYPCGGNYWSDYTGVDLCRGPYQNRTGRDGLGDTPYTIDAFSVDRYPILRHSRARVHI